MFNKSSTARQLPKPVNEHPSRCSIKAEGDHNFIMKHVNRAVAFVLFLLAAGVNVDAQSSEQTITVVVKPSQTVQERVSDSIKEKELREAAEEKHAAEKSASIAAKSPRYLLGHARTIFICSSTSYFEPVQLQNALRKRSEFEAWEMAIIDRRDKGEIADMIIEVDRPLFTFTFTYKITDRSAGILLTAGKVTAWDGNAAAPLLARTIVEDIKKVRGEDAKKE